MRILPGRPLVDGAAILLNIADSMRLRISDADTLSRLHAIKAALVEISAAHVRMSGLFPETSSLIIKEVLYIHLSSQLASVLSEVAFACPYLGKALAMEGQSPPAGRIRIPSTARGHKDRPLNGNGMAFGAGSEIGIEHGRDDSYKGSPGLCHNETIVVDA